MTARVFDFSGPLRPSRVLERFRAQQLAARAQKERQAAKRDFMAARGGRLTAGWVTREAHVNSDLEAQLPTLRARSRDLFNNTELGRRFRSLVVSNVVGSAGPRLQVRAHNLAAPAQKPALDVVANAAIEQHWAAWCARGSCEITGKLAFADVCKLVLKSTASDGEYLVRRVRDRALPYGFALQALDVNRLDHSYKLALADGGQIRMGVELSPVGRPRAYWLAQRTYGDAAGTMIDRQRVAATDVLHDFIMEFPEQVRGFPWMHAVMHRMNMLAGYEEAAVLAARIGASKMGFFTRNADADPRSGALADAETKDGELIKDVDPGTIEELPPGYDFKSFDPDYPHQNFESFMKACLRGVAAGLDVAAHNLSGDMTDVNYSSARIAELAERDVWRGLQGWFIASFVRPVYAEWLRVALLNRQITLPSGAALPADRLDKFLAASSFQPRGWAWVDPNKEVEAALKAIDGRLKSRRQVIEEQGGDFEDVLSDLTLEQQLLDAAGLQPVAAQPKAPAPPAPEQD